MNVNINIDLVAEESIDCLIEILNLENKINDELRWEMINETVTKIQSEKDFHLIVEEALIVVLAISGTLGIKKMLEEKYAE